MHKSHEINYKHNSVSYDGLTGKWFFIELPVTEYKEAWALQGNLVTARKEKIIDANIVLLLEHAPVFTLGRRGGLDDLLVSKDFLKKNRTQVVQVERGGTITFHGPGQIIVYPIIDLRQAGLKVVDYVTGLEEVMIKTAEDWGIKAGRNSLNRGVWVGSNKLGSIGITVRHGISFHGLALNVNIPLKPFTWINPCGLKGIGMTSFEREVSRKVSMKKVREAVKCHFEAVFGVELVVTSLEKLNIDHIIQDRPALISQSISA